MNENLRENKSQPHLLEAHVTGSGWRKWGNRYDNVFRQDSVGMTMEIGSKLRTTGDRTLDWKERNPMTTYRDRIYENYSSGFQDKGPAFDAVAARRWGNAYDWYFRNWLPADKDAHIVDLACGAGSLLHFFRERGYSNVAGVDISPEQVALSRQVTGEVTQDNVLHFLQTHEDTFDLITALDLVEHFHKDEVLTFLDGCYAALRSGGRLILQTPNAETPWAGYHRYNDLTHEVCFQSNSLSRLMRLTGFVNVTGREQGPVPKGYSITSTVRYILWHLIRLFLQFYNVVETGGPGTGIFTRVFLASGVKP